MGSIAAIAGLGNPGDKYAATRHNAGFWFVDELARRHDGAFRHDRRHDAEVARIEVGGTDLWLIKPMAYMNESGGPLRSFLAYYRIALDETLVAHDEIDLPVGTLRMKRNGGHGGHNGLRDIIALCGREFARLRVGVGHPGSKDQVVSYVLRRAPAEEQERLNEAIDKAADVVPIMVRRGVDVAMNRLNARPKKKKPPKKPEPSSDASDDDAVG